MTKIKRYKTSLFFIRPTFFHGVGSIFNIAGNYFEFDYSSIGEETDKRAIENDWGVVGNDIRSVTNKSSKKHLQLQD